MAMTGQLVAGALALTFALGLGQDALAGEQTQTLVYAIEHPEHGAVGTLTNVIENNGSTVKVEARTRILVKMGFLTLFRHHNERREVWCGGRLVSYESYTEENSEVTKVEGQAVGDRFILKRGNTMIEGSAGIFPTNPWSRNILNTTEIISPVKGSVQRVTVVANGSKPIRLGDRETLVDHFAMTGDKEIDAWYDREGTLVKFTYPSDHDLLTFTLKDQQGQPIETKVQTAACSAQNPSLAGGLG
jgi:hypothetical protein